MGQRHIAPVVLAVGLVSFRPPLFASLVLIILCALYGFFSMRKSQSFKSSIENRHGKKSVGRAKKWLVVLGSGGHTTEMMLMLKDGNEARMRRNTYHFIYTSEHCRNACTKAMASQDSHYWWISKSRSVRKASFIYATPLHTDSKLHHQST